MAWRLNPFSAVKRALDRRRAKRAQPPAAPTPPPAAPTFEPRTPRVPPAARPSPAPRGGEHAPRERAIMSTIAALHATGVTERNTGDDSHSADKIQTLEDELGLAGASEILREQLESTRAYLALARQLGRHPRVGESQPGNERWHERDSKYGRLRRANGSKTMSLPNWYDKFFYYHGTNI